jgi:alpha-beta hydrolase superfamily lysophospholipase
MNPSLGTVPSSSVEVQVDRRLLLPGRVWPHENPRAVVAIVHGLGEYAGRYAALASDLVNARFTVVALDLPGHGNAIGPRGDIPAWVEVRDKVVPAMFTALRGIPGQTPGKPRVLLGHSMGAVMALDYAIEHPRELLACVSSAAALKSAMPPWWKLALANVARIAAPSAGFAHGLEEAAMSRDPEVRKLRKDDPLIHDRISPRLYFQLAEAQQRVMRGARTLAVPTLMLHGMADRVADPKASLEFTGAAPHGMARLITYRDAYHEIFNDLARADVIRDVKGWLDAVVVV